MSLGSIAGGVVGGIAGFFIGGPMGAVYGASIGFGVGALIDPIMPDIPSQGSPAPESDAVMTSTIGDPIPDLAGTAKITGHLLIYGNERTEAIYQKAAGGGGGKGGPPEPEPQITGYNYYMSWVLGFCVGPINTIYAIYKNNQIVWEGSLNKPSSGGKETIVVDGLGSVDFYFGTDDQVVNSKVGDLLDDATLNSPYRNFCWAFFDDCLIGNYPRTPTISIIIKKIPEASFSTKSTIQDYDCNAMHAIYYILNNLVELPTTYLNNSEFAAVAQTLADEYRGLSILFKDQQSAQSYIQMINSHINGILRWGSDSTFKPKLIRNDYIVSTLPSVNEDTMLDDPLFTRKAWIDTLNEVKVQYTEIINVERPKIQYGILYGVGKNDHGSLGIGDSSVHSIFEKGSDETLWFKIACGPTWGLGIKKSDNSLWQWGDYIWKSGWTDHPVLLDSGSFIDIACGYSTILGIKSDGTLWGASSGGADIGITQPWSKIGSDSDWFKIDAGQNWIVVVKNGGTLYGMGKNTFGQFGFGNSTDLLTLTLLNKSGVTDISAGQYFLLISVGKSIWAAGQNGTGQIGNGAFSSWVRNFYNIGTYDKAVACCHATSALLSGNALYQCGQNIYGCYGLGDTVNRNIPTLCPGSWKIIAPGMGDHTIGIRSDGTIWGAGNNSYYQLGLNVIGNKNTFQQEYTKKTDWKLIVCGQNITNATR